MKELKFIQGGNEIVFSRQSVDNAELWAVNSDGTNLRLLTGGHQLTGQVQIIDLSYDEVWIAFNHLVKENGGELWVAKVNGSEAKRLVAPEDLMAVVVEPLADFATPAEVKWLANSHQLIYDAQPGFENGGIYIYVQRQILQVVADSGIQSEFLPLGEGGQVSYSPDGHNMAVITPDRLRIVNLETLSILDPDILFFGVGFGEYYAYPSMIWTLDSQGLIVAQPEEEGYSQEVPVVIWNIPLDGSKPTRVGQFAGFFPTFRFSADRQQIAFWRGESPGSNTRELHIAYLDGSEQIVYETANLVQFLGWSPDISFIYTVDDNPWQIKLGHPCHDPIVITKDFYPSKVNWIHSAFYLVENRVDQRMELYLGSLDTDQSLTILLNIEISALWEFRGLTVYVGVMNKSTDSRLGQAKDGGTNCQLVLGHKNAL